ncbi:TPA: ATP-binding cassette domain-containing protein [Clostridioides difficile]
MDVINIKKVRIFKKKMNRVLNLVLATDKKFIIISLISSLVLSTIPLLSLNLMQKIVNFIQIGDKNIKKIFTIVILYLLVSLIEYIVGTLVGYYNTKFTLKFDLYLQNLILEKASNLSLRDFEDSEIYDKFNRAQQDMNSKIILMVNTIITLMTTMLTTIMYIIKFINFSILMIPFIVIIPIIKFFVTNKINIKQYNIIRKRTTEQRKSWYYSYLITNGDAFKELKINHLFSFFISKYNSYVKKFNEQDLNISKERIKKMSILELLEEIVDGVLFMRIIYLGIMKFILIGDVVTYTKLIVSIKENIKNILNSLSTLNQNSLYINMLFELLDMKEENKVIERKYEVKEEQEIQSEFENRQLIRKESLVKQEKLIKINSIEVIEFIDVSFKYKKSKELTLKNINLKLERGDSIAIVGLNGSGKTTLGKLIMGYYSDYEGSILVNGFNMKEIDISSYREKLGFLFQDFLKFEATLRENIYYGNLDLMNNDEVLGNIIDRFDLNKIIDGEKNKFDISLGYWFDDGKQLSLGQWHRVALGRTFVKNADVYLLDEPNSSLDPLTENSLSNLYSEVFEGKIGIIITHRFINIVKKVDKIIVIDNGTVVESGIHEDLLNNEKLYSRLYKIQLEGGLVYE